MAGWPNKIARVAIAKNPGYQKGAIESMAEAVKNDYFKGYDWVIRINPDVMIIKESSILDRMANHAGVFAMCCCSTARDGHGIDDIYNRRNGKNTQIHTDFYAARTDFLIKKNWVNYNSWVPQHDGRHWNAEKFAAAVGFRNILEERKDSWIVRQGNGHTCRVESGDVLHDHDHTLDKCHKFAGDSTSKAFANIGSEDDEPEIRFLRDEGL